MSEEQVETEVVEESAPEVEVEAAGGSAEGQEEAPWEPDWTYKFNDEQREIDEFYRPLVKDQESLDRVRDLMQINDAFPGQKERMNTYKEELDTISGSYQELTGTLQKLATHYQNKDMEGFFKLLGVDDKDVQKYAVDKWKYSQLPEEERMRYDNEREIKERNSYLEERLAASDQERYETSVRERSFQLDQELGKAEIHSVVQSYDGIYGSGAFRDAVIKEGQYEALTSGRDLPAVEAVSRVLEKANPLVERLGSQPQQISSQGKPRVIPNVSSAGAGNVAKKIDSIDKLRELSRQLDE